MDLLQAAAISYNNLLYKKFHIKAGAKGNLIEFDFIFKPINFFHLAGLHYLEDLKRFGMHTSHQSKELAFKKSLRGELTLEYIEKSAHFTKINERVEWLHRIDAVVSHLSKVYSPKTIVEFDNKNFSFIKPGYTFVEDYPVQRKVVMLFFTKDSTGMYLPESFLVSTNQNKILQQKKYRVLDFSCEFSR